ncbi:MAG: hypothetical protein IPM25_08070 [Chloracidobacterium sp.]|nr:hypothetical protein [Chloracidobacterium sp.]
MGFLKKIFGAHADVEQKQSSNERNDVVIAYDEYGNEFAIAKDDYRKTILAEKFREVRDNPDKLYDVLVISLQDGFFEDCLAPARRLMEIEKQTERSAAILGITLMQNRRLKEAKTVLEDFLYQKGASGIILTNLAKVKAEEGDIEGSQETLWQALNVDPNQENGLKWFAALARDEKGDDGFYEAIEQVSKIKGSWRPQLWLARALLENKKIDSAVELYSKILQVKELPPDVFMMISGDLGNSGYIVQMVDLMLPIFDPQVHGPMTGINLMQALHVLGDKRRALEICESLEELNRYDIMQHLKEWRLKLG